MFPYYSGDRLLIFKSFVSHRCRLQKMRFWPRDPGPISHLHRQGPGRLHRVHVPSGVQPGEAVQVPIVLLLERGELKVPKITFYCHVVKLSLASHVRDISHCRQIGLTRARSELENSYSIFDDLNCCHFLHA